MSAGQLSISTIIPAFNAAATLHETLDSIAAQTIKNIGEIIVVDDGSGDESAAIAKAHPAAPTVITTKNCGAASAINTGMLAATGDVICILDADDLWTKGKLELQVSLLTDRPEIDAVLGHSEAFQCPTIKPEAFESLGYINGPTPGYLVSTLMVRRKRLIEEFGLFDTALRTGYFIEWYRHAKSNGMTYTMLDTVVHKRRIRPGTLGKRFSSQTKGNSDLSRDFLEIARRAIQQKNQLKNQ